MRTPAALFALLSCAVPMIAAAAPARPLLQAHREAEHQDPVHHLDEARRALDRAWGRARPEERKPLDRLRTDFAALALAFNQFPRETPTDALAPSPTGASTTGAAPQRSAPAEPTEAGPTVPPRTEGVTPPAATSSKRPSEWQLKYADVDRDLKSLAPSGNRALANRLGHFRTHLQMFYASALGRSPR